MFGKGVLVALLIGFPIAVIFAWAFELQPDGIKETISTVKEGPNASGRGGKTNLIVIGSLVFVISGLTYQGTFIDKDKSTSNVIVPEGEMLHDELNKSVAVLPVVNISSDKEQESFFRWLDRRHS